MKNSVAMSRQEAMRFARGLYDTGKNRITSRTVVRGPAMSCIIQSDGRQLGVGASWALAYSNMRANHDAEQAAK